jgi:hypothetical protein
MTPTTSTSTSLFSASVLNQSHYGLMVAPSMRACLERLVKMPRARTEVLAWHALCAMAAPFYEPGHQWESTGAVLLRTVDLYELINRPEFMLEVTSVGNASALAVYIDHQPDKETENAYTILWKILGKLAELASNPGHVNEFLHELREFKGVRMMTGVYSLNESGVELVRYYRHLE